MNEAFAKLLAECGFEVESEFRLDSYRFDFKVGNVLIELNPWVFHNCNWSPVGEPKHKDYHAKKSQVAGLHGYRCVHVWDWDDWNAVVKMLLPKQQIHARSCEVKVLPKQTANAFIAEHHL